MEQTPFKAVFTKKTNFVTQSFDTDPLVIDYGAEATFLVPRHGDFITRMYLLIDYESLTSSTINHALAMLDHVSLIIGGTTIQQESGETLNLRLNVEGDESQSFSVVQLFRMLGGGPTYPFTNTTQYPRTYRLQVPLRFWFHGKTDLALPLVALRYQEVEVEVGLRNSANWGGADAGVASSDVRLRVEYGYAPDEVVKPMMSRPLIFPTEQFQMEEKEYTENTSFTMKPKFVNPVKAVFALFKDTTTDTTDIFDYSRNDTSSVGANDFLDSMEIILDNQVLMPKEVGTFEMYRGIQYYTHFAGSAQNIVTPSNRYCSFIYPLAFCKDPMNRTTPNGSINFSTILNPLFNIVAKKSTKNYYLGELVGDAYAIDDVTYVEWSKDNPPAKIGDYVDSIDLSEDTKIISEIDDPDYYKYILDKPLVGNYSGYPVKPYFYNPVVFRLYALSMNLLYIENGVARLLFTGSEIKLPRFL